MKLKLMAIKMKLTPMLISISLFSFLSFLRRAIFYAFFYVYLRTFLGLSNTLSALLGTANLMTSTIGQLKIWGPRLDLDPNLAKRYVVRGEVIAGFVYLFAFFGHRIFINLTSYFIAAIFLISCTSFLEIFWSGSDLGIRHLTAEATKGSSRGRLVGTIDGFGLFGQLIGYLIGGFLFRDGLGFYEGSIFYIVVFLIFSCAIVIFFASDKKVIKKEKLVYVLTSSRLKETLKGSYGFFILILVILILGLSSSYQIFLYYATDISSLNFSDQLLSYLLILFTLSGGLLTPIGGKISDRIGRIEIIFLCSITAAFSYFFLFILGQQPFFIIAILYTTLGGSSALIQSISFAYSADILQVKGDGEFQGTGYGIFNIALATGWGLAGFLIGGPISDLFIFLGESNANAYRFSFLGSSLILFLGSLLIVIFSFKRIKSK